MSQSDLKVWQWHLEISGEISTYMKFDFWVVESADL